jgi:serine/threonine protein phosphatase PrpC
MVQTWIVVAIVVAGVAIALAAFVLGRGNRGPAAKKVTPAPAKDAGARSTPTPEPAGAKPAAAAPAEKGPPARAQTVPEPAVRRQAARQPFPGEDMLPEQLHEDDDDDITIVTLTPRLDLQAAAEAALPDARDDDDDDGPPDSSSNRATAVPIFYDAEATEDEPTRVHAVILVGAVGQTDRGQKRKINEDRYLALDDHNLYVVADGMGGHAGGEVASQLAVDTIAAAFKEGRFEGEPYSNVPRRAGELALAIQMANRAIHEKAKRELKLHGMGTTIVSARFTPGKERVYIGHVGDSRCYRFRAGQLTQLTTDHTMGAVGMTGPFADHLSRAVGIAPQVKVDVVIAKPRHDDVFLLCSDGLSKMVKDDAIREILAANTDPDEAVKALVQRANERGGRDNITVILVVVKDPKGFARHVRRKAAEVVAAQKEGDPDIVMNEPEALSMASAAALLDPKAIAEGKAALEGKPAAETKPADAKPAAEAKPVVADVGASAPDLKAVAAVPPKAGSSTPPSEAQRAAAAQQHAQRAAEGERAGGSQERAGRGEAQRAGGSQERAGRGEAQRARGEAGCSSGPGGGSGRAGAGAGPERARRPASIEAAQTQGLMESARANHGVRTCGLHGAPTCGPTQPRPDHSVRCTTGS